MNIPAYGELDVEISSDSIFLTIWVVVFFAALFVWGHFGILDINSITQGEVIPSSQVKKIQHLEGGIIREIFVHEGDVVSRDQPLLTLEGTASGADRSEIQSHILALRVEIRRLEVEAARRSELKFTREEEMEFGERAQQAKEQFAARRLNLRNSIAKQSEAVVQRQQDIQEIQVRLLHTRKKESIMKEQVDISNKMIAKEIANRYEHLDLMKEYTSIQSRIEEDSAALGRAMAMLKEANAQIKLINSAYEEDVAKQLESARRELNENKARIGKFDDNVRRTTIKSPVRGVVKTLNVATMGGVIKAGDTILDIVPEDDELVIEAKLAIRDIGYITVGQKAKVRLISSDASRFGELAGKVVNIGPDTLVTKDGNPFYKARIETEKSFFSSRGQTYRLVPGMIVQVSILTGTRTVLEYVFSPLFNAMHAALEER
ncbi:MAG: HlyD family type I secretion periplasmic adaptor subunit [Magnetococcales bacterium]|nr:HlyD family type I secretion periplasmic adaptor subunit [Magnetococcales bacterium]